MRLEHVVERADRVSRMPGRRLIVAPGKVHLPRHKATLLVECQVGGRVATERTLGHHAADAREHPLEERNKAVDIRELELLLELALRCFLVLAHVGQRRKQRANEAARRRGRQRRRLRTKQELGVEAACANVLGNARHQDVCRRSIERLIPCGASVAVDRRGLDTWRCN